MPLFSKNIQLKPALKLSTWRKIAIGTWRTAGDPSVYAVVETNVEPALRYLEKIRQKTGQKITLTHFTGKALAHTIEKYPDLNCILRFGRLYPRKTIDVFFQVASDKAGKDLSGTVIREANRKSLVQIAQEMQGRIAAVRTKDDPDFKKMKKTMGSFPGFLIGTVLKLAGFFMYGLNLWSPLLGSPKDAFGSVMVTSIGSIGLEMAFAPLVPYSRVSMLMAVGATKETPIIKDGKVEIARVSKICVTFDHRIIDGMLGSLMAQEFQTIFNDPEKAFGEIITV